MKSIILTFIRNEQKTFYKHFPYKSMGPIQIENFG